MARAALTFLALASARNRARLLLRKLGSPRHAVPLLLGVAWLAWMGWMAISGSRSGNRLDAFPRGTVAEAAEHLVVAVTAVALLLAWLVVPPGALGFSEAEVQFLFPGPLTRRRLLLYRLGKSAVAALLGVLLLALLVGPGGAGIRLARGFGAWLALTALSLHLAGAALTRLALRTHGAPGRALALLPPAAGVAVAGAALWRIRPVGPLPDPIAWARALLETPPLSWALLPVRALVRPVFATDGAGYLTALPGALAVLAVMAAWVAVASRVPFEEAAVAIAQRAEARLAAVRRGVLLHDASGRSFRLNGEGRPEVAFLWKGLLRIRRVFSIQAASLFFVLLVVGGATVLAFSHSGWPGSALGIVGLVSFVALVLVGPNSVRGDLRDDVEHLDVLKALPLRGHQVLLAEISAPLAVLTVLQWVSLLPTLVWPIPGSSLDAGGRAALAVALGLAGPAVSGVGLAIKNALVALYPRWHARAGDSSFSLERLGLGMAESLSYLLVVLLVAPAAALAFLVLLLLDPWLGALAYPLAALAGTLVLAGGFALGVAAVGQAFQEGDA